MKRHKIVFYTTPTGKSNIDIVYDKETFWLSQKKLAELFGTGIPAINKHIKNILDDGELDDSTISKMEIVQTEGKREVTREVEHYNLDMIIAVGYRVSSKEATQFRIWATQTLVEFVKKGFVLDDERLKNGQHFGEDYFKELLQRIREIRSSERRIYQQITDIFKACSIDYDKESQIAKNFYANIQNKFHYAITGKTAAEIVYEQSSSKKPNMGLMSWKNSPDGNIIKSDVSVAKNYLEEKEIRALERLSSAYFDYIEGIVERRQTMDMLGLQKSIDKFLDFNEYQILDGYGNISHDKAKQKAEQEYSQFKEIRDKTYESDFDKYTKKLLTKSKHES
jgi:hypothetical protein